MKANIDGVACEGTPEEISEFKKLRDNINQDKLWKQLREQKPLEIIPKDCDPHTDSVTVPNKPYVWQGKGNPYDAKFCKTSDASSCESLTKENEIKCESDGI